MERTLKKMPHMPRIRARSAPQSGGASSGCGITRFHSSTAEESRGSVPRAGTCPRLPIEAGEDTVGEVF